MKVKQMAFAVAMAFSSYAARTGMAMGALAQEVDAGTYGALPEAQRGWYTKDGEKYKLDLSKVDIEDVGGLKSALQKERDKVAETEREGKRKLKELADKYKDIDPEKYREILGQFDSAEEAELLKQGAAGMQKILDKRTEKLRADFEKKEKKLTEERDGALEVASTYMDRVLDNHVRAAATAAGVHPGAVDDVLLRARQLFTLDDDGNPVQYVEGSETDLVMGKDGKTPFAPAEWLGDMAEKAPHWFPASSSGGGASGDKGGKGAGGGKTIKRAEFDKLDAGARVAKINEGVKVVD